MRAGDNGPRRVNSCPMNFRTALDVTSSPSVNARHRCSTRGVSLVLPEAARSAGARFSIRTWPFVSRDPPEGPARRRSRSRHMRRRMGAAGFGIVLAAGAAFVALWIDVRWAERRPESPMRRMGHSLAAYGVLRLASVATVHLGADGTPVAQRVAVLFL